MQGPLRPKTAVTTYANTPETDLLPTVLHTVTLSDGSERYVMAACPIHAVEIVTKEIAVEALMYLTDRSKCSIILTH